MKQMKFYINRSLLLIPILVFAACEDSVSPQVYSEMIPETVLTTEKGIEATLGSAYSEFQLNGWNGKSLLNLEEWTTDIEWETGGGENLTATQMINFVWDPSTDWIGNLMWDQPYRAIRNANVVLDNVDLVNVNESKKETLRAEARFVRAVTYYRMYLWFGPIPLRTSIEDDRELPRAGEEEMISFIESELLAAIPHLPEFGNEPQYGRAHKSAARAFLVKLYLNTKQWQEAADMAEEIVNNNLFSLYPDYHDMFKVDNERNSEFIWVHPATTIGPGNLYVNGAFPPGFREDPNTGIAFTPNMNNWAAQYRIWDSFYNSFEPGDERINPILTEYIHANGETVSLLNNNNVRSLKYWPDSNASGNDHGNDITDIRYADILLSRAEALNELNGPNDESIELINQVRNRANLDDINLTDFSSTEQLRDHILNERGWEFYSERKRRQDLIRHNKFIERAHDRGMTNAQDFHKRFPIPQREMDSNPLIEQNPGY